MTKRVKTIDMSCPDRFDSEVQLYLDQGYKVSSTSCGFVQSEAHDFCGSYQAILIKEDNE